jgi:hypothetical protein
MIDSKDNETNVELGKQLVLINKEDWDLYTEFAMKNSLNILRVTADYAEACPDDFDSYYNSDCQWN